MHAGHAPHADAASLALFALLAGVLLAYWRAARRDRGFGGAARAWRCASFGFGMLLLACALAPPLMQFAHADLRGHMIQHLLLGMFAPVFLVLGAPATLLLRSLPIESARSLTSLLAARPIRFLVHPVSALLFDIGGMALLYLSPLFAASQASPALHFWVHLHFLVSGYLFAWAIAGPDPAPHRPGLPLRLAVLFLAGALHGTLSKWIYAHGFPRGTMYEPGQIQAAAQLMYYGGDLAELLLASAFFALWFRNRHPMKPHQAEAEGRSGAT